MMFMSCNSTTTHVTIVENLLITLPKHMSSSPFLSVVHVFFTLVLCIVFCFFKLFLWLTPLKQVYCDNTIEKLLVELGLLLFIPWYITILFSVFNSNKLMTYLCWSTTNNYWYQYQLTTVWYFFVFHFIMTFLFSQ